MTPQLKQAYATCRRIARERARNFYYGFLALPKQKRDAMCAVYAFMRRADDLADNPERTLAERRDATEAWLSRWHQARDGGATDDPVFLALRDTASRFRIPADLLDELVAGTTMDLREPDGGAQLAPYASFEDLYRYCYLVASVVGLVCIRIFGYEDVRAEQLAEQTGIAFQLTNILRDVKEDAELGRIYLPREDMERYHLTPEQLLAYTRDTKLPLFFVSLMQYEAERAARFYQAAEELLPLVSEDSRGSLWVLVQIYRRLLQRIQESNYNVFATRIAVPPHEKIGILLQGLWRTLLARLGAA